MAHHLADGLHKEVGSFDDPVQVADVGLDSPFLHLADGRSHMEGGDLANPLPGIEKSRIPFQISCLGVSLVGSGYLIIFCISHARRTLQSPVR